MVRRIAFSIFVLAVSSSFTACGLLGSDGGSANPEPLSLPELCQDLSGNDGNPVEIPTSTIKKKGSGSTVGCGTGEDAPEVTEDGCCPKNWRREHYYVQCSSGTQIKLTAAKESGFATAKGKVVDEEAANMAMTELIKAQKTDFGCVGQTCHLQCTPTNLKEKDLFEGTYKYGEGNFKGQIAVKPLK